MKYILIILLLMSISYADDIGTFYVLAPNKATVDDFKAEIQSTLIGTGKVARENIAKDAVIFKNLNYTFKDLKDLEAKGYTILNMKEVSNLVSTDAWTGNKPIEVIK